MDTHTSLKSLDRDTQESGHGQIQEQVQSPTDTEYQIHGDSGAI